MDYLNNNNNNILFKFLKREKRFYNEIYRYIVGCRGASQLGGSLLGIPLGYKANKL